MSKSVLDSVAMAYQPVWGRARRLVAVRVGVLEASPGSVDAAHVMQVLGEDWPAAAPLLIVAFQSEELRWQATRCAPVRHTWVELGPQPFTEPEPLSALVEAAHGGMQLLRRMPLAQIQGEIVAPLHVRSLLRPSADEALQALQSRAADGGPIPGAHSPLVADQLYEGIGGRPLADHCLDVAHAWGVAGWPDDDVLHAWRDKPVGCDAVTILQCRQAIERDASLEQLERHVRQDPVLVYRLLALVNSASYGLRHEIESLRHAIMMLGMTALGRWLSEQLHGSETDRALHPVRFAQVMRSRLAQHLLDSGAENDLRSEVYFTSLLSQMDRWLHEPLSTLLHRIPLPGRTLDALLRQSGPYLALLEVSGAQSRIDQLALLPALCEEHEIPLEQANRALLRMLATSRDLDPQAREHPWAMDRQ
ncbi:MAG: HDOD domain-containing protein [Burkholderiaceae bacterium]